MKNNRLFLDIHAIQILPPSNVIVMIRAALKQHTSAV